MAKLEKNRCTIAIIPHTVEMTNLHSLKAGDPVNLEADLIAKYVEKMMKGEQQRRVHCRSRTWWSRASENHTCIVTDRSQRRSLQPVLLSSRTSHVVAR